MAHKVFISMGSTATSEQRAFIDAILHSLKTADFSPRIINENEWSFEQPLKAIRKVMDDCCGAVIIAFTRTRYPAGIEIKKDKNKELTDISLPTPWNHIEAAMAYTYNMPMLVIAENGLKKEGLLEQGYDWMVYWTDLEPAMVTTDQFRSVLDRWKDAVTDFSLQRNEVVNSVIAPDKITIGALIKSMNTVQFIQVLTALVSGFFFVAAAAFKAGGGKWPW